MSTSGTDGSISGPDSEAVADSDLPQPQKYTTDSGMVVDVTDIEVDVVPGEEGEVVSSQADADAYGVDIAEDEDNLQKPGE